VHSQLRTEQPALGRPVDDAGYIVTGPVAYAISVVAIVALGATLALRRRRDGRDDETAAARRHCRLLRRLRGTGDVLVHRAGRGDFSVAASPRNHTTRSCARGERVTTQNPGTGMGASSAIPVYSSPVLGESDERTGTNHMRTSLSRPQQLLGGDRRWSSWPGLGAP